MPVEAHGTADRQTVSIARVASPPSLSLWSVLTLHHHEYPILLGTLFLRERERDQSTTFAPLTNIHYTTRHSQRGRGGVQCQRRVRVPRISNECRAGDLE